MVCPLGVLETPEVDDEISKTFMRIFSDLKKGDGLIPFKEPKALFEKEYSTDLNKEIKDPATTLENFFLSRKKRTPQFW